MKLYGCNAVEQVIEKYVEKGGDVFTLIEGALGYGLTICCGNGLKTTVITEIPLNCWSSGHKIRMYNKMPEKYKKMLYEYEAQAD